MTAADWVPVAVLAPVATALAVLLLGRWPNLREAATMTGGLATFVAVASIAVAVAGGERPAIEVGALVPGIAVAFAVDPLGALYALVAGTLWIANSVYSIGYMRGTDAVRQTPFYLFFAIAIACAMGIAFSANLFTLFLFYEALTLSTYPLVIHNGTPGAIRGGRTYLLILLSTSIGLLLPAIVITGSLAGTLDFTPGGILAGAASPAALGWLLALYVFGIGKAAVMPVHAWLPAAMVAPTPVSALLHAVAVVKAGVFSLLKVIVSIFGIGTLAATGAGTWLVYVAGGTIIAASLLALRQTNLKRMLAYSTVSQLSYVVLAAALLTPVSVTGAALHIAGHAVSKITLFFAAGSVYAAAHIEDIAEMRGLGRRMPWTMAAFSIGALSMIGLPLTAGFLGKWFILSAATSTEQVFAVAVIVLSTALNAGYYLPIVWRAFLSPPASEADHPRHGRMVAALRLRHEPPLPMVLALTATAVGTVALFVFPGLPFRLAGLVGGGG